MIEFFKPLIDPSFWFALQPNYLSPFFEKAFFLLFSVLLISGSVIRIRVRRKGFDRYNKIVFLQVGTMFITMGVAGMFWFFFSYEGLYLIGARFWFLVWGLGFIAWASVLVRFARVDIPSMKEQEKSRADANKYLPRKKKR